jgi:hypothetical protein
MATSSPVVEPAVRAATVKAPAAVPTSVLKERPTTASGGRPK